MPFSVGITDATFKTSFNALAFKVPDFDTILSSGTEPVSIGAEAKRVNYSTSLETIKPLALCQVPQQNHSILATTSAE